MSCFVFLFPGPAWEHQGQQAEPAWPTVLQKPMGNPDAKITFSKATLDSIQLKEKTVEQAISSGELKIEGRKDAFTEFLGLLDTFPFWFNIVTL